MIRVGFLQDHDAHNADERRYTLHHLADVIGRDREPVLTEAFASEDPADLATVPECDVLVVDYGALHAGYGAPWERYGRAVRDWAEAHPGRLVLIWTAFTTACYRAVFDDEFPALDNVLFRYGGAWEFDETTGFRDRVRAWLA